MLKEPQKPIDQALDAVEKHNPIRQYDIEQQVLFEELIAHAKGFLYGKGEGRVAPAEPDSYESNMEKLENTLKKIERFKQCKAS